MLDFVRAHWPFLLAVPAALGGVFALGSKVAKDAKHAALSRKLEIAHEALDVLGRVVQKHGQGETWSQALLEEESSDEAQDLLSSFLTKDRSPSP